MGDRLAKLFLTDQNQPEIEMCLRSGNPRRLPSWATSAASAAARSPAAAAAGATTPRLGLRPGFIHHQRPPQEILPIADPNSQFRVLVLADFDKTEAPRIARKAITH